MKQIVLFSTITEKNKDILLKLIFPEWISNKVCAYMPSNGANCSQTYINEWENYAEVFGAEYNYIDNSQENSLEIIKKLTNSNILVISGGNTFELLNNLRKSGLGDVIKRMLNKDIILIAGFSAGGLVLTPTIEVCNLPNFDQNLIGLTNLKGLELVPFEIFPHYKEALHKESLYKYRTTSKNEVKEITDDDYLVVDL
ncbi:MAG: Type 1 glutamine amidotransferase-like domain-containing protein [Candidatus Roizmanbacteria bacterium]